VAAIVLDGKSLAGDIEAALASRVAVIDTTVMIADFDAETRFALRAERGRGQSARGSLLLEKARGKRMARRTVSK